VDDEREKRLAEMMNWRARVHLALALGVIVCAVIGVIRWRAVTSHRDESIEPPPEAAFMATIAGAVVDPGEYMVLPGDTIRELIVLAGGFAEGADRDAVNSAVPLDTSREIDIHIPYTSDYEPPPKAPVAGDVQYPININTASATELQALKGIGPALAERIVKYREDNGPFRKPSDIMNVDGIGWKTYEDIFGLITAGDSSAWEE
jgi:competence protein ComEA